MDGNPEVGKRCFHYEWEEEVLEGRALGGSKGSCLDEDKVALSDVLLVLEWQSQRPLMWEGSRI